MGLFRLGRCPGERRIWTGPLLGWGAGGGGGGTYICGEKGELLLSGIIVVTLFSASPLSAPAPTPLSGSGWSLGRSSVRPGRAEHRAMQLGPHAVPQVPRGPGHLRTYRQHWTNIPEHVICEHVIHRVTAEGMSRGRERKAPWTWNACCFLGAKPDASYSLSVPVPTAT